MQHLICFVILVFLITIFLLTTTRALSGGLMRRMSCDDCSQYQAVSVKYIYKIHSVMHNTNSVYSTAGLTTITVEDSS